MILAAPVTTLKTAEILISAGAKEIYLGFDEKLYSTFSFTGRGKVSYNNLNLASKFDEFKTIIEYAHCHEVKVNLLGNIPFFNNGIYNGRNLESYFIDYVEKGIGAGADALVIGDLGLLNVVSERNYPIALHASVYFKTINYQQLLFLKELGVRRTTLSYQITMEEIMRFCKAGIMEIEVIGYLGCSFFNGACGFLHEFGEGVFDDFDPGVVCKGIYTINDGDTIKKGKVFDAEAGCSICILGELERIGVKTLKIVGRDRNYLQTAEVVALYNEFIDYYREGYTFDEKKERLPAWWKRCWCLNKSCKYISNENSPYIIGGNI